MQVVKEWASEETPLACVGYTSLVIENEKKTAKIPERRQHRLSLRRPRSAVAEVIRSRTPLSCQGGCECWRSEQAPIDGTSPHERSGVDDNIRQGIEITYGSPVPHFRLLNAQGGCPRLLMRSAEVR